MGDELLLKRSPDKTQRLTAFIYHAKYNTV